MQTYATQMAGHARKKRPARVAIVVLLAHSVLGLEPVLAGGTSGDSTDPELRESVLSDPESVNKGEARFSALCAYCHGHGGVGGKARKLQGRQLEIDYIFNTITNGKKRGSLNMPPWRGLPERERWELVAYILSLSGSSK